MKGFLIGSEIFKEIEIIENFNEEEMIIVGDRFNEVWKDEIDEDSNPFDSVFQLGRFKEGGMLARALISYYGDEESMLDKIYCGCKIGNFYYYVKNGVGPDSNLLDGDGSGENTKKFFDFLNK